MGEVFMSKEQLTAKDDAICRGYLRSLLRDEVLRRDLVDGDEAKAAGQNIRRLQRAATRKKSPGKATDEFPILAPVEDASSSLPRAVVSP
jgi:hypothetical protein